MYMGYAIFYVILEFEHPMFKTRARFYNLGTTPGIPGNLLPG